MTLVKALFASAVAAVVLLFSVPAFGWDINEMNKTINQTNFILEDRCSATLINLKEKLVLTNHHCIDDNLSVEERDETGKDGSVKKVRREKRSDVTLVQKSYKGSDTVGASALVAEIVFHKKSMDLALLRIKADSIPHT